MRTLQSERGAAGRFAWLRAHLDHEFRLLRTAIAAADPAWRVPSCPEWDADRLAHHVAETYLHKVACIEQGKMPEDWPPADLDPSPTGVLDQAYAALAACFDAHRPSDPAATWYGPDQTVGFWIRRMCHESVVHRVDAELTAGLELAPIPEDIALDGIDEFLTRFLAFLSQEWPDHFADLLPGADRRPVTIAAGGREWTLTVEPERVAVGEYLVPDESAYQRNEAALIGGEPGRVLLWLWGRLDERAVSRSGDPGLAEQFAALRRKGTG